MSDNLQIIHDKIGSDIDPAGAPGSVKVEDHRDIEQSMVEKMGKYSGFTYNAIANAIPTSGNFSWENNPMNELNDFTVKFNKINSDGLDMSEVFNFMNAKDLIKFKDFIGRTAILIYQSHSELVDGGENIIKVVVKGISTNPSYAYNGVDSFDSVFEFERNLTNTTTVGELNDLDDVVLTSLGSGDKIEFDTVTGKFINRNLPTILITTAVGIDTTTTDANDVPQKGRNVGVDNGATAINYDVNSNDSFYTKIVKLGTADMTFIEGAGRTLVFVDDTDILTGEPGAVAEIFSIGVTDYLRVVIDLDSSITVTGISVSYNVDWRKERNRDLTFTADTVLTESNIPKLKKSKIMTLFVKGDFLITLPVGWVVKGGGVYDGINGSLIVVQSWDNGNYHTVINDTTI